MVPTAPPESDQGAAQTADDMGQLGDVVLDENGVPQFAAQIKEKDKNQGQGDGARFHAAEGGEQNHHKHRGRIQSG